jgi:hypothetical protein
LVVEQCPPAELYALDGEVAAALASFPPVDRQRMRAFLAMRRMARPAPRPAGAAVPAPREPVAATRTPGHGIAEPEFIRRVDDISTLLATVHPGEAEAAFRLMIADLADDQLLAREERLLDLAGLFLPKRRRALVALLEDLLDVVDVPAPAPPPVTLPVTLPAPAAVRPGMRMPPRPAAVPAPRPAPVARD